MKQHRNPAWPQIEQALTSLEKQELVRLLQQLCDVSDDAYRFVLARFRVGRKLQTRIAPYRAVTGQRFSFRHDVPPDLDFGLVSKTIHDYREATDDVEGVLSLQLCCIENATSFMSQFGIPDALFFQGLAEIVSDFADLLKQNSHFHAQFARRIRKVKQQTGDFGYGYTDFVIDKFSELDSSLVDELV